MNFLIILVLVFVCFLVFRKKLEALLLPYFIKMRKRKMTEKVFGTEETVFSPVGTVRTFSIQLELHEQGDGKVRIVLVKNK